MIAEALWPVVSSLAEVKQELVSKIYYFEFFHAQDGTLIKLVLQSVLSPHGGLSLSVCIIHKEGICLSSGDFNRLMMVTIMWCNILP
jgi:hypothetical protein